MTRLLLIVLFLFIFPDLIAPTLFVSIVYYGWTISYGKKQGRAQ
jgi:hypothetical protein